MARRIVFVHTVLSVAPQFVDLARELLPPDVEAWHVVDELLAKVVAAQGHLSPFAYRRVADHARAAEEAGASMVQLTCSSISPCTDAVSAHVGIPVFKIDEPMADRAISLGRRIGVAATATTALDPTADLIRLRAEAAGRRVEVRPVLCAGAYAHLVAGDLEMYDRVVRETLEQMVQDNDVVVLAQASMAGAAQDLKPAFGVSILTSPRLAVERLARLLNSQRTESLEPLLHA
jgi:Asp/Glu/hydantoin racemase